MQWVIWPLKRAAWVPLAGIGLTASGGVIGAYTLSRNATWLFIGNKQWETNKRNHQAGLFTGLASGSLAFGVMELAFKPEVPTFPPLAIKKPPVMDLLKHAVNSVLHTLTHYPYRFRAASVLLSGCVAGIMSVYGQKAYAERSLKYKNRLGIDPDADVGSLKEHAAIVDAAPPSRPETKSLPDDNPEPAVDANVKPAKPPRFEVVAPANDPDAGMQLHGDTTVWVKEAPGLAVSSSKPIGELAADATLVPWEQVPPVRLDPSNDTFEAALADKSSTSEAEHFGTTEDGVEWYDGRLAPNPDSDAEADDDK